AATSVDPARDPVRSGATARYGGQAGSRITVPRLPGEPGQPVRARAAQLAQQREVPYPADRPRPRGGAAGRRERARAGIERRYFGTADARAVRDDDGRRLLLLALD